MALKMYQDNLDTYISTFKHLCTQANYDITTEGTMHLFAQGLKQKLLESILYRQGGIPTNINEWEDAARDEMKKHVMDCPAYLTFSFLFHLSRSVSASDSGLLCPSLTYLPMDYSCVFQRLPYVSICLCLVP